MKKLLCLPLLIIMLFSITACNDIVHLSAGDVLKYGEGLNGKTVSVSGYVYHLGVPKYNEKYGYVTYYLKLSDDEEIQVNYSGSDAETISYDTYDILEAEGVVTKIYTVSKTILQLDCKKLTKTGQATPAPKTIKSNDDMNGNNDSVTGLMKLSMDTTDQDKKIYYAKKACEKSGIEPKILTDTEYADLLNKIDEIDTSVDNLRGNQDEESRQKMIELQEEKLNMVVLKFYNQVVRMND